MEGCAVPIHELREFVQAGNPAFVWDDQQGLWVRSRHTNIFPGMIVMLPKSAGGYSTTLGWTGESDHRVESVPPPGLFEEDFREDLLSERGEWVPLAAHLRDVQAVAEEIANEIGLAEGVRSALITAAAQHDVGKALGQWQDSLPTPRPIVAEKWAKAPFLFAVHPAGTERAATEAVLAEANVRSRRAIPAQNSKRVSDRDTWQTTKRVIDTRERATLSRVRALQGVKSAWMVPFRPGLRHEAASALALWHLYFRGAADFPALSIYLAASHHGKVRTVLTARSKQGEDVCGVSKSAAEIPWAGGLAMDFSCASDGAAGEFSQDGSSFVSSSPGWTALMADLLGGWERRPEKPELLAIPDLEEPSYLGPFALSFLETLLRCADMRASQIRRRLSMSSAQSDKSRSPG